MGHMTVLRAIMAAAVAVRLGSAGEPEKMSPTGTEHRTTKVNLQLLSVATGLASLHNLAKQAARLSTEIK